MSIAEEHTFDRIFLTHYGRVRDFIAGFVKSAVIAEELAQDVFMKLWEIRSSIDLQGDPGPYLYAAARNRALNHIRRKNVENSFILEKTRSDGAGSETSVEEDYYARETQLLVDMTVSAMPERRREIYELSRSKGLANDEIAEYLGISKKTVENHMTAALADLRRSIKSFVLLFFH